MTDLLEKTLARIKPVDRALEKKAQERLDGKVKPIGALGRLEEIGARVVSITGREDPEYQKKFIVTMAGDHGVAEEGLSVFPQETTLQMMKNFEQGIAGVNVLARHVGAEVIVVDMGAKGDVSSIEGIRHEKIAYGTNNMVKGPAMTREQAVTALETGIQVVDELVQKEGVNILGTGDMGIANTTPSAAIVSVFSGLDPAEVTGRGTGIDDEAWKKKVSVIERAIEKNKPNKEDAVDVLSKVGGFEIGGLGGLVLGAAANRIPVVVDGFIATAGALVACELCETAKQYVFASHMSVEKGHRTQLERIGQVPLLDLGLRLGEGTGAALAIGIVEAAIKILSEMASFAEAKVFDPKA